MTVQTLWTPGRAGWQGKQGSIASLVVLAVFMAAAAVGYAAILLTEASVAHQVEGVVVIIIGALAAWALAAQMRVSRVRVLRVEAEPERLRFGRPRGILLPLRLLGLAGAVLLGVWIWTLPATSSDRLPVLSLILTPVVALCLVYGGIRSLFVRGGALVLDRHGVQLTIARTGVSGAWDDIAGASFDADRVTITLRNGARGGWAARDLASDPVVLAELITFYARTPRARAEIGDGTLARLRAGEF